MKKICLTFMILVGYVFAIVALSVKVNGQSSLIKKLKTKE